MSLNLSGRTCYLFFKYKTVKEKDKWDRGKCERIYLAATRDPKIIKYTEACTRYVAFTLKNWRLRKTVLYTTIIIQILSY